MDIYIYHFIANGTSGRDFPPPPTNPLNKLIRSFAMILPYLHGLQSDTVN
jgi:hypothetical protein